MQKDEKQFACAPAKIYETLLFFLLYYFPILIVRPPKVSYSVDTGFEKYSMNYSRILKTNLFHLGKTDLFYHFSCISSPVPRSTSTSSYSSSSSGRIQKTPPSRISSKARNANCVPPSFGSSTSMSSQFGS